MGCVLVAMATWSGPAWAGAWWRVSSRVAPSYLPAGSSGVLDVAADDLGDRGVSAAGSPITLNDVLPPELRVTDVEGVNPHQARVGNRGSVEERTKYWKCTIGEHE